MAKKEGVVLDENTIATVRASLSRTKNFPTFQFDAQVREFKTHPEIAGKNTWIKWLMQGCGLSCQMLADGLGTSRQEVHQLLAREQSGQITIKKMQHVADVVDCDFVYAFIPRDNEEMVRKITIRSAQHLRLELIEQYRGTKQYAGAVAARIKKFLARRTGWGIIWECEHYKNHKYQWWLHDFQ